MESVVEVAKTARCIRDPPRKRLSLNYAAEEL
jgi:hypothetical protein